MRGAYYVATALVIAASSRTAAGSGQPKQLRPNVQTIQAAKNVVVTTLPQRHLRDRRDVHDALANTAERMDVPVISKFGMEIISETILTDAKKGFDALEAALIEAAKKAPLERQIISSGKIGANDDASHSRFSNEWKKLVEESYLPPHKSKDSPVIPDKSHAAEQPDTSHQHPHLASTVDRQTTRKRDPPEMHSLPKKTRIELQVDPPSEPAALVDSTHDQPSKEWTHDFWAREIDMQPIPSKVNYNRALSSNKKRWPPRLYAMRAHRKLNLKATHNKFVRSCSPIYHPTKEETAAIWTMVNWQSDDLALPSMELKAKNYVVLDMLELMKTDQRWALWVSLTPSLRVDVLNNSLNAHYQRWMWMYDKFKHGRPSIPKTVISSKSTTKDFLFDFGKSTQPILPDNIGKSSAFSPPAAVESQNLHPSEPTLSEMTIKDLLINFGQSAHPRLDDNIGKSSDKAPSVHLTLGPP